MAPALAELQEDATALAVVQDGRLMGLVTLEDLREYVVIEAALQPSWAPWRVSPSAPCLHPFLLSLRNVGCFRIGERRP